MASLLSRLRAAGFSRKQAQRLTADLAGPDYLSWGISGLGGYGAGRTLALPERSAHISTGVYVDDTMMAGPLVIPAAGDFGYIYFAAKKPVTLSYVELTVYNAARTETLQLWNNNPIEVPADVGQWMADFSALDGTSMDVGSDLTAATDGWASVQSAAGGQYYVNAYIQVST